MTRTIRFIALLVAALVLAAMLFSTAYIAAEADHDCTGEQCPICYQISICQNILKQFTSGATATALAVALTYMLLRSILPIQGVYTLTTLITFKVKLLN